MSREKKLGLLTLWVAVNIAWIWGNSLLNGDLSGDLSQWVKDLIFGLLFPGEGPSLPGLGLVRKLAHFLEFASLGLALRWLWRLKVKPLWLQRCLSLGLGVAVACTDEAIQRFVPGRHGCWQDVGIDCAGVLFGVAMFCIAAHIHHQKTNNTTTEERK